MPSYGYDFGATGGDWGSGVDVSRFAQDAMKRLLTPEEFGQLDPQVRAAFGNYMTYLQTYARQRKNVKAATDTYNQIRAGTYQVPDIAFDNSVFRAANAQAKAARGPTPTTRIERDITGRQRVVPVGARQDIKGNVIPLTPEQEYAVPMRRGKAETEFLDQEVRRLESEARRGLTKAGAEQIRLEQADKRIKSMDTRAAASLAERREARKQRADEFNKTLDYKQRRDKAAIDERRSQQAAERAFKRAERVAGEEFKRKYAQLLGKVPGTDEERNKRAMELDDAIVLLERRMKLLNDNAQRQSLRRLQESLVDYQFDLEEAAVANKYDTDKVALAEQRARYGRPAPASRATVRRMVNGRVALFDAATREFVSWE